MVLESLHAYTLLQQGDVRIHYTVQAVLGTHDSKIAS